LTMVSGWLTQVEKLDEKSHSIHPSSGQNGQLVRWWVLLLVHCGRVVVVWGTRERRREQTYTWVPDWGEWTGFVDRRVPFVRQKRRRKKLGFLLDCSLRCWKRGFVLLERTRISRQQERRSACAFLRAWKCVLQ
jgi:hypothetical protein